MANGDVDDNNKLNKINIYIVHQVPKCFLKTMFAFPHVTKRKLY